jgi:hypothetical protein
MNDKRKKPPRRGVEFRFGPPESTRLPSPWDPPTPAWVKQLADELGKQPPANHDRSKRSAERKAAEPTRKARVKRSAPGTPPLRHQMILAILADVYGGPDGYAGVPTTVLVKRVEGQWTAERKKRGVDISPPGWDSVNRAVGRDQRQP